MLSNRSEHGHDRVFYFPPRIARISKGALAPPCTLLIGPRLISTLQGKGKGKGNGGHAWKLWLSVKTESSQSSDEKNNISERQAQYQELSFVTEYESWSLMVGEE